MERLKRIIVGNFELMLVVVLVAGTAVAVLIVVNKLAFLDFFYIPTLVAAYFLGRKTGILTGALSVLLISAYALVYPALFAEKETVSPILSIAMWACFLLLTASVVGTLYQSNERAAKDLRQAYEGILEILAKYIDAVDSYTANHSVRVSALAATIAQEMRLPAHEVDNIRVAGLLHDVGKINVSLEMLTKASSLDDAEWEQMKTHTTTGASLLQPVGGLLHNAVPIVLHHHEKWDGSGYNGKKGEEIPLGARILAVADAYDSMVTDRPYRTGRAPFEAVIEVQRHSGTQFDPEAVAAFVRVTETEAQSDMTVGALQGARVTA